MIYPFFLQKYNNFKNKNITIFLSQNTIISQLKFNHVYIPKRESKKENLRMHYAQDATSIHTLTRQKNLVLVE